MQKSFKVDLTKLDKHESLVTPLNRAELLDYLQEICGGDCFRRQTYYLAQSYIDQALTRQDVRIQKFQLLGITALFMAAKMEELEPQVAPKFAKYTSDFCSAKEICSKEREVVQLLNWRLNPDTLYFWMEYYVRMWDQFVFLQRLDSSFSIKKKKLQPVGTPVGPLGLDEREFLSTAEDKNQTFFHAPESFTVEQKGSTYRRIIQALDLISLDNKMHEMKRHALCLAVLAVSLMQQFNILNLDIPDLDLDELEITLDQFIGSNQDLAFQSEFLLMVEAFLVKFCPEVCEDLGIVANPYTGQILALYQRGHPGALQGQSFHHSLDAMWVRKVREEILYVVNFFTVETQFSKPQFRRSRRSVALESVQVDGDGNVRQVQQVRAINEPFLSKEDYLSVHVHTKQGLTGCKRFLFQ